MVANINIKSRRRMERLRFVIVRNNYEIEEGRTSL